MQGIRKAGAYEITTDGGIVLRRGSGASYPCYFADGKIVTGAQFFLQLPDGRVTFAVEASTGARTREILYDLYALAGTIAKRMPVRTTAAGAASIEADR